MTRLIENIFRTHRPTWDNIMQLLASLFSTEERYRINTEARKWLQEMVPEDTANPERWIEQAFPSDRPNWDHNTEGGKIQLDRYRTTIIQGFKKGALRPTDMSKLGRIAQKGNEPPSEFCETLWSLQILYTHRSRSHELPDCYQFGIYISSMSWHKTKASKILREFYPCLFLSWLK